MLSEWVRQCPLDVLLSDMTCSSDEGMELRELLESADGVRVVTETMRPEHRVGVAQSDSVLVLVVPHLAEPEQQQLMSRFDPREGPVLLAALQPDAETISRLMDGGAVDYFSPPWDLANILPRIRKAVRSQAPRREEVFPTKKKLALDQMIPQI